MTDQLPRAFGPYLLFDVIGRGGMAEIFLAREATDFGGSRRVVIKQVLSRLSSDNTFADLLVHEAKLSAQLSHRNIVQVRDLGRESGRLFIAMDYVEGFDLNQLLRELSLRPLPLPAQFALLIIRGVLAALDYAHRAADARGLPLGVVHRDVSPSNILISFEGEVRLCDFGIARALDIDADRASESTDGSAQGSDIAQVMPGLRAGKSAYMAPEHAVGGEADPRSDIFAAGIVLWELCAGRRLYQGTEEQMLALARAGEVPPLPAGRLPQQASIQAVLDRALRRDPAARYQTAGDMLQAVEEYALANGLMASELRFADFLTEHFSEQIIQLRRSRERVAETSLQQNAVAFGDIETPTTPVVATSMELRSAAEPGGAVSVESHAADRVSSADPASPVSSGLPVPPGPSVPPDPAPSASSESAAEPQQPAADVVVEAPPLVAAAPPAGHGAAWLWSALVFFAFCAGLGLFFWLWFQEWGT